MSHRLFSSPLLPFVSNPLTSYWPVAPGPVSPALVVSTSRSILWDTIRMGHCISLSHCSFCNMIFLWRNWNYFPIAQRVKFQLLKPYREAPQPLSFFLTSYFDLIHIHSPRFLAMGLLPFLSCVLDFPSSCVHVTFHSEASFPLVCFSIPLPPACVISTCSNHIDLSPLQWNTVTLLRNEVDVHVLTWNDIEGILPDDKHIVQQYI